MEYLLSCLQFDIAPLTAVAGGIEYRAASLEY